MPIPKLFLSIPSFDRKPNHPVAPIANQSAVARSGGPGRRFRRRASALPWMAASTMANCFRVGSTGALIALAVLVSIAASERAIAADQRLPSGATFEFGTLETADSAFAPRLRMQFPPDWAREATGGRHRAAVEFGRFTLTGISSSVIARTLAGERLGVRKVGTQDAAFPLSSYLRGIRRRFGLTVHPGAIAGLRSPRNGETASHRIKTRDIEIAAPPAAEPAAERVLRGSSEDSSWTNAPLFVGRTISEDTAPKRSSEPQSNSDTKTDQTRPETQPERATTGVREAPKSQINPLFISRSSGRN